MRSTITTRLRARGTCAYPSTAWAVFVLVVAVMAAPVSAQERAAAVEPQAVAAPAAAQGPTTSFDQLARQVRVGDKLWVTSTDGHETRGRLEQVTATGLSVNSRGTKRFEAAEVSLIRQRQHDSVKTGALIGLGIGGAMATAWCIGAVLDDSGDIDPKVECPEGFIFAGLGTLIGAAVDAIIPGKLSVIYRANAPAASNARASLSVVPVIGPHRVMLMGVVRH